MVQNRSWWRGWSLVPGDQRQPFILDPASMVRGRFVTLVGMAPGLQRIPKRSLILLLGSIDTRQIADVGGITPERCAALLAEALGMPPLNDAPAEDADHKYFRVDLIVSDMRVGSPQWLGIASVALRFLSLLTRSDRTVTDDCATGSAWLQVEGLVSAAGSAEPTMTFSHRLERADFEGYGGSTTVTSGPDEAADGSIALLAAEAARDILSEVGAALTE